VTEGGLEIGLFRPIASHGQFLVIGLQMLNSLSVAFKHVGAFRDVESIQSRLACLHGVSRTDEGRVIDLRTATSGRVVDNDSAGSPRCREAGRRGRR
jgi:hypothetical protein